MTHKTSNTHMNTFFKACIDGNLEQIRCVIKKVDVTASDNLGLWYASRHGHLDIVKFLTENGATDGMNRALTEASYSGHYNVVRYLVECGADISTDKDYSLRWSVINRHCNVVEYLVENMIRLPNKIPV